MTADAMPNDFVLVRCGFDCAFSHEGRPIDAMGYNLHFKCIYDGCAFASHCKTKNHYLVSLRRLRCMQKQLPESPEERTDASDVQRYAWKIIPCLQTLTNLPATRFIWLIQTMEKLRPNCTQELILSNLPKTIKQLHRDSGSIADELWQKLRNAIDDCFYYGIAVDTGIDRVKSEHIIISVLYVREKEYVLPPLYSPKASGVWGYPLSCKGQKHILQYFSGVNNFCNLDCKRQLVTTVPPVPTNNNFTTLPETLQRFLNLCRVGLFQFKERLLNSGFQLLSISGSKKIFVCVHHRPQIFDRIQVWRFCQGRTEIPVSRKFL